MIWHFRGNTSPLLQRYKEDEGNHVDLKFSKKRFPFAKEDVGNHVAFEWAHIWCSVLFLSTLRILFSFSFSPSSPSPSFLKSSPSWVKSSSSLVDISDICSKVFFGGGSGAEKREEASEQVGGYKFVSLKIERGGRYLRRRGGAHVPPGCLQGGGGESFLFLPGQDSHQASVS